MTQRADHDDATARSEPTDGRLLRGMRSRRVVARAAADLASVDGLAGVSLARVAVDAGVSKSGVQGLFATKEKLQLAAVDAARTAFLETVVRPAAAAPSGLVRIRALVERWIAYVKAPVFPGGCFWAINLPAVDSQPGAVRDALLRQHDAWLAVLAGEVQQAVAQRELARCDPDVVAFHIDAVLSAANTARRLGDQAALGKARRIIDDLLDTPITD